MKTNLLSVLVFLFLSQQAFAFGETGDQCSSTNFSKNYSAQDVQTLKFGEVILSQNTSCTSTLATLWSVPTKEISSKHFVKNDMVRLEKFLGNDIVSLLQEGRHINKRLGNRSVFGLGKEWSLVETSQFSLQSGIIITKMKQESFDSTNHLVIPNVYIGAEFLLPTGAGRVRVGATKSSKDDGQVFVRFVIPF